MQRKTLVSKLLKGIAILIILIGIYIFFEYRLWRSAQSNFAFYLKIFIPILVLGFSGTLWGISLLLDEK